MAEQGQKSLRNLCSALELECVGGKTSRCRMAHRVLRVKQAKQRATTPKFHIELPNPQQPLAIPCQFLPHFEAGETCSAATICGDSQKYQGALSSLIAICSTMHSVETIHRLLEASLRKKHAATAGAGRRHDGCIAAASESSLRVGAGDVSLSSWLLRQDGPARLSTGSQKVQLLRWPFGSWGHEGHRIPSATHCPPLALIWQRLIASHCRTDQKRFGRPRFKDPNALLRVAPIMRMLQGGSATVACLLHGLWEYRAVETGRSIH